MEHRKRPLRVAIEKAAALAHKRDDLTTSRQLASPPHPLVKLGITPLDCLHHRVNHLDTPSFQRDLAVWELIGDERHLVITVEPHRDITGLVMQRQCVSMGRGR
jgi:hypothetical protein